MNDLVSSNCDYECCKCSHKWSKLIYRNISKTTGEQVIKEAIWGATINAESHCPKCNNDWFKWLNYKNNKFCEDPA